jgi:hypothetical protein
VNRFAGVIPASDLVSTGIYTLMWDLAKSDIFASNPR